MMGQYLYSHFVDVESKAQGRKVNCQNSKQLGADRAYRSIQAF